jgi:hypothetical protein
MGINDYISNRVFDGIRPITGKRLEILRNKRKKEMSKDCGCGRSPTGKCIGWHGLTNEEYSAKIREYEKKQLMESAPQLLKE